MADQTNVDAGHGDVKDTRATAHAAIYPLGLARDGPSPAAVYLNDLPTKRLVDFFRKKGLATIKEEDRLEQWYADWLAYQAEHHIYASVLSAKEFSSRGCEFNLLRYTRFLEVFAYFSPAHGYSAQVTFLGLFSILMGSNDALKREAVAALEQGGLMAFGVSERAHGSDLLANEFQIRTDGDGRWRASGSKYYIGNTNSAAIVSILAKKVDGAGTVRGKRVPVALIAVRPTQSPGFNNVRKIRTHGVRAAFVGEFEVKDHDLAPSDVFAEGRQAWDAVMGTVTLGKFFLGFGSIGMCEHALEEGRNHLNGRILYDKPVIEMPHIRIAMTEAYARLTAMKLYAYRALDYVQAAGADDRRYLLYCAVQKAKVSTEGVKVMSLLSECVGARGFESDSYFEMALRDIQLVPGLESSAHINLALTAQFCRRYFGQFDDELGTPPSLVAGEVPAVENAYLMEARSSTISTIGFPQFLKAYGPVMSIPNVRLLVSQAKAFRLVLRARRAKLADLTDTQDAMALGRCLATIAYAQLIAENAARLGVAPQTISVIFHLLVGDLTHSALALASFPRLDPLSRLLVRRLVSVPRTTRADWDFVAALMAGK